MRIRSSVRQHKFHISIFNVGNDKKIIYNQIHIQLWRLHWFYILILFAIFSMSDFFSLGYYTEFKYLHLHVWMYPIHTAVQIQLLFSSYILNFTNNYVKFCNFAYNLYSTSRKKCKNFWKKRELHIFIATAQRNNIYYLKPNNLASCSSYKIKWLLNVISYSWYFSSNWKCNVWTDPH